MRQFQQNLSHWVSTRNEGQGYCWKVSKKNWNRHFRDRSCVGLFRTEWKIAQNCTWRLLSIFVLDGVEFFSETYETCSHSCILKNKHFVSESSDWFRNSIAEIRSGNIGNIFNAFMNSVVWMMLHYFFNTCFFVATYVNTIDICSH